jgi:hypothetical protein
MKFNRRNRLFYLALWKLSIIELDLFSSIAMDIDIDRWDDL